MPSTSPDESTSLLDPKGSTTTTSPAKSRMVFYLVFACVFGVAIGGISVYCFDQFLNLSSQEAPRNSKYSATQFLSFSINTLGGRAEYGECEGRFVDDEGSCYLGNKTDLSEDLNRRFKILELILNALAEDSLEEKPKIDHASNVLKIFMMPEFFLRGPFGAYSVSDLKEGGLLPSVADRIYNLIGDSKFEDWLFVFGTIILAQSPDDPKKPWEAEDQYIEEGEILYFNFAPVAKGGSEVEENKFELFKDYISTVDFLDRKNGLPNPRKSHVAQYNDLFDIEDESMKNFIVDQRGVHIVEGNVFEVDGIRFGMEICLDHRMGVLWENLQRDNGDLVDIHLITSAGMSIERGPTPIKPHGVVYLTDGEGSSAACQRTDTDEVYDPHNVCQEGPIGLKHVPNLHSKRYNSYITPENCFIPRDEGAWKNMVSGYYSNYRQQGCAFTLKMHGIDVYDEMEFYPPSVEVYPTIDLP